MYIKLPYDHSRDDPLVNNKKGRSSKSRNILRTNGPDQYKKQYIHINRTDLKQIGPTAPIWVPR